MQNEIKYKTVSASNIGGELVQATLDIDNKRFFGIDIDAESAHENLLKQIGGCVEFPVTYVNGNYRVTIESDGTKTRSTPDSEFKPTRPETLDINISNYCENNCKFCHIGATKDGKHGNLDLDIFNQLDPYTEIAINYAEHPGLSFFLHRMATRKVIVNMTINKVDILKHYNMVKLWIDAGLIYGLGISVTKITYDEIDILKKLGDNVVYHIIAGITEPFYMHRLKGEKVLMLGFKNKGRGENITPDLSTMRVYLRYAIRESWYKVLSFDNLAINQLYVANLVDEKTWRKHYMGEEGEYSFYIDTVDEKYYKSSTESKGRYIKNKTIKGMFLDVKG